MSNRASIEKADLVLHEGQILGHPESDSVAVAAGTIVACGPFGDLKSLVGPQTHMIRLAGRTVAPGFIDSHLHFLEAAAAVTGAAVWRGRTIADLLADLRVAASKTPPGNWLRAFGCDEALIRERRGPTLQELDQAVPRNPLRLRHQTLHASWLNSRALKQIKLDNPGFKAPPGAFIERDAAGRPTGLVAGMEEWIGAGLPLVTAAELESRARTLSRELAAMGVTAFTDATVKNGPDEVKLFVRFAQSGAIAQRIGVMVGARHLEAAAKTVAEADQAGVRLAGIKFMPDGSHGTAAIARSVATALARGFDCAFHVTEIEELEWALSSIEKARHNFGDGGAGVCRIEHGGLIPSDYIERIAALGAWVVTNPGFIYYRGAKYAGEPGLASSLYRARSLAAAGINLAGATDAPVTPARPLAAIAAAITRTSIEGYELAPQEALDAPEALALFTVDGARLGRLKAGAFEIGRLGDLIVLPKMPLELGPPELLNLPVDITVIGGRVVYERGRPAFANSASAELHSG
ncbi:MAG TPA: amidohydrolase family protein [Candidatus Binataceae bacterium]|nr:amidohydrolase family protein [Candidatus Binataceae bacterium]